MTFRLDAASLLGMTDWSVLLGIDGYRLQTEASPEDIRGAEATLSVPFPEELRSLLRTTDGLFDTIGQWFVIWPLNMLVQENLRRREYQRMPSTFVAFGDDGAGEAFCLDVERGAVYCWYAIDGRANELAGDMPTFLHGWTDGTITT
jgi:hypothetical protein